MTVEEAAKPGKLKGKDMGREVHSGGSEKGRKR